MLEQPRSERRTQDLIVGNGSALWTRLLTSHSRAVKIVQRQIEDSHFILDN